MLVKRNVDRWLARDILGYFRTNPNIWRALNSGQAVEIPDYAYEEVAKYVILVEDTIKKDSPHPSSYPPPKSKLKLAEVEEKESHLKVSKPIINLNKEIPDSEGIKEE